MKLNKEQIERLKTVLSSMIDEAEYEMGEDYVCPFCHASINQIHRECNMLPHESYCPSFQANELWDELKL